MTVPATGVASSFQRGRGRRFTSVDRHLATRLSAGRVLIVDDEEDLRDSLGELLSDEGYDVSLAENGRDALEQLAHIERPCWVLLDLFMPGMSGFDFLDALAAADDDEVEDVHVVVMTSAPAEAPEDIVVIGKPASMDDVLEALDRS